MRVRSLTWLRGASGAKRYIGKGAPWALYRCLDPFRGVRGELERVAVAGVGRCLPGSPVRDQALLDAWSDVEALLGTVHDGLVLFTHYYKPTLFVGPVRTAGDEPAFVKVFADPGESVAERDKADLIAGLVGVDARVVQVVAVSSRVVAYECLPHLRRRPGDAELVRVARELGHRGLERATGDSPLSHIVAHDEIADRLTRATGSGAAFEALSSEDTVVPIVLAHGDLTPWNAFLDERGQLCIVDYERVGPASPFTDYFHLRTQPAVISRRNIDVRGVVGEVAAATGTSVGDVTRWYVAYLAVQLKSHLEDLKQFGRTHHRLHRTIPLKLRALAHLALELAPRSRPLGDEASLR